MSESSDGKSEKYVGQRGPDKQPREFNPKSLLNLKQYYTPIPAVNSITIANWSKIGIILIFTIILSIVIWKIQTFLEKTRT